jgi:hypothetical protein
MVAKPKPLRDGLRNQLGGEIAGVEMPGRSFTGGIRIELAPQR